jgi:cytochrome bd-type quinol oxidase subunit 2
MIFKSILGLILLIFYRVCFEIWLVDRSKHEEKLAIRSQEGKAVLGMVAIYLGIYFLNWIVLLPGVPPPALTFWLDPAALSPDSLHDAKLQALTAIVLVALPLVLDSAVMVTLVFAKSWDKRFIVSYLLIDGLGFIAFWWGLSGVLSA